MNSDAEIVGMFELVLGGSALCWGWWQRWREVSPRCWRKVSGKIVGTNIVREYVGRGAYQFLPVVEYDYEYGDHKYRSARLRAGNFYGSGLKEAAEAVVSRYPIGKAVEVFVNPRRPERSVLEFGVTAVSWIFIGLGVLLTAVAFFSLSSR